MGDICSPLMETRQQALPHSTTMRSYVGLLLSSARWICPSLDSIDREDLFKASRAFSLQFLNGRKGEVIPPDKAKLAVGYEKNGIIYDMATFGNRITGYDAVEADNLELTETGYERLCFLAGKQISQLSQSDGTFTLDAPIGLDVFEQLDIVDVLTLCSAAEVWRNSFRGIKEAVQGKANVEHSEASTGNRVGL
jgi:hypothetical protein